MRWTSSHASLSSIRSLGWLEAIPAKNHSPLTWGAEGGTLVPAGPVPAATAPSRLSIPRPTPAADYQSLVEVGVLGPPVQGLGAAEQGQPHSQQQGAHGESGGQRDGRRHLGQVSGARGGGPFVPRRERFLATWWAVTSPFPLTITFYLLSLRPTMATLPLSTAPLPVRGAVMLFPGTAGVSAWAGLQGPCVPISDQVTEPLADLGSPGQPWGLPSDGHPDICVAWSWGPGTRGAAPGERQPWMPFPIGG